MSRIRRRHFMYKKLSYRRDSESRRLLLSSKSSIESPYDFLLVKNTNLQAILHSLLDIAQY